MLSCSRSFPVPMSCASFLHRRALASRALCVAAALACAPVSAQMRPEKSRITLAVGGKSSFLHLPLTIAEQLGFFRAEGLTVEIGDAGSAGKALAWVLEGAADVCAGSFEQVLNLRARGQAQQAFALQCRAPQAALGVASRNLPSVRSAADLRGRRLGVPETGATAKLLARRVLQRSGVDPAQVVWVETGGPASAVAALRSGQIDALAHSEPVISLLEQKAEVRLLADTRTLKGTQEVFGGGLPTSCLHAPAEFVQRHPGTCQALAHGLVHALKWLQTAGPGDIVKTVPEPYLLGDRALYLAVFDKVRETFSPDGLLAPEAARNALRVLAQAHPDLRADAVDLGRAYTNEFSRRAKQRFRA